MPVVPFSRNEPQVDDSLMPSNTHLMMAAATIGQRLPERQLPMPVSKADKLRLEGKGMEERQTEQDRLNPVEQIPKRGEEKL